MSLDTSIANSRQQRAYEPNLLSHIIETQSDLTAVELDPQAIMKMVAERTHKLTRADGVSIELIDGDHLVCHAGTGIMRAHDGRILPLKGSLAGHAVQSGSFQYAPDTENDPRMDLVTDREMGLRSLVAAPLLNASQTIGVIVVASRSPSAFDDAIISSLRLMAGLTVTSLSHVSELEIKKKLLAERTEALTALRKSEQKFHSAFEYAAIGMALVGLDGRFLQVNPALCRILDYTQSELLVKDFQSLTHSDDVHADLAFVAQLIAGEIADYRMVKRYIHRQGHLVWVLLSVSIVKDDAGNPLHFISQIQDITQRQHAEEALRASEEGFRATFELAGVGKAQADLKTNRFIRVNKKLCEITGYSQEELCRLSFAEITYPDDVDGSRNTASQMLDGGISERSFEKRYIHKDGKIVWVSVNTTVLKDSSGHPARAVATILDITERKHAEWLESDRRRVLEMVARDLPLPDVLARLAEAVERQIDGCISAVMVVHNGKCQTHGHNIPADWSERMASCWSTMMPKLSSSILSGDDTCNVTHIMLDEVWQELRPIAVAHDLSACWSVSIRAADGSLMGLLLAFHRRPRCPTSTDNQTLGMAAKLASICIEHNQTTEKLSHLVRHDSLTGLPNRLMFEDAAKQALALARRSGKSVGVMVLDIDKFKTINDTLGHHAGDLLLQLFSHRLHALLRETDTMARMGGDEFVILLPNLDHKEAAVTVAQKLLDSLASPFRLGDQTRYVTSSIGLALFPEDGQHIVALQKKADTALYRVKNRGRNGFSF